VRNAIEIELWDDAPKPMARDWRANVPGKKRPAGYDESSERASGELDFDALLDETHHRQYGRPWSIGRSHFDYLVQIGLRPQTRCSPSDAAPVESAFG
jgi:hypothetical protein